MKLLNMNLDIQAMSEILDFLDAFESGPVYPPVKRSRSARVAETSPTYRATSRRKRSR